jgi:AMP-binding enzyme
MTIGMWSDIDGVGSPTGNRDESLARRIAELYASDEQFGAARPLDEISAAVQLPGMRLPQIVQTVMEGYADRPALGQRVHELVTDDATGRTTGCLVPRLETITYHELWTRAGAVASAWQHTPVGAGDFVAIMGFASSDYTTLDLACIRLGAVSVPLQTGASVGQLVRSSRKRNREFWPSARTFSTAQSNPCWRALRRNAWWSSTTSRATTISATGSKPHVGGWPTPTARWSSRR